MAGGGVGEAALMGAVLGGGASAIQGGDPLKGALMGGALGAGGAALMPEAAAAAGGAEAAAGAGAGAGAGASATEIAANIAANPSLYPAGATAANTATMFTPQGVSYAIPSAGSNVMAAAPASSGIASLMPTTTAGKVALGGAGLLGTSMISDRNRYGVPEAEEYNGPLSRFTYDPSTYQPVDVSPPSPLYRAQYAAGGTVEQMSRENAIGMNTGYPQADITGHSYATPWQTPASENVVQGTADTGVNRMNGQMLAGGGTVNLQGTIDLGGQGGANPYQSAGSGGGLDPRAIAANPQGFQQWMQGARQQESQYPGSTMMGQLGNAGISGLMGYAEGGGISSLGKYSDGGRMLKGPGDGMSDSIPATIANKQPARLADGEFVVSADVVSHIGNGSTDAGARQLYKMMDRVRTARTGRKAQGRQINPRKYMPA